MNICIYLFFNQISVHKIGVNSLFCCYLKRKENVLENKLNTNSYTYSNTYSVSFSPSNTKTQT